MSTSGDTLRLERLGCVLVEIDPETWLIQTVSTSVRHVLGYSVEECREKDFLLDRLIYEEDVGFVTTRLMESFEPSDVEFTFRAKAADGCTVAMRALVAVRSDEEERKPRLDAMLCRSRAEVDSSGSSEERLRLALDSADMGVWDWNLSQWTIFWSDQVYQLHGTTREEIGDLFASYDKLVEGVHPEDRKAIEDTVRQALRTGEDYELEYRYRRPDGTYRWLNVQGRTYFDDVREPVRIAGTAQDVTARKSAEIAAMHELRERRRAEAELKQLAETLERRVKERTLALEQANRSLKREVAERARAERKLARANRRLSQSNKELQNFAYVASHDLKEPLRKISTFADLLRCDYEGVLDENALFYIGRMQASAERMTNLIRDLLQFSRVETAGHPFASVDFNIIVQDVLADLEMMIQEAGAIVRVADLPSLEADPTQMRQLFQNLISNALKFRKHDASPEIEINSTRVEDDGEMQRAGYRLTVRDNGIGLHEQYAERIFDPFQRLHTQYEGTGMGLAICRRIVERHQGAIHVVSRPGEGSTFIIRLPAQQVLAADAAQEESGEGAAS